MAAADDDVLPSDVIKVLDCNLNLLEITLLGENIGPSASMEIEQNVEMIKNLIGRLKSMAGRSFPCQQENTDDTLAKEKSKGRMFSFKKKEKSGDIKNEEVVPTTSSETPQKTLKERVEMDLKKREIPTIAVVEESPSSQIDGNDVVITEDVYEETGDGVVIDEDTYEITHENGSISPSVSENSMTTSVTSSEEGWKTKLKEYQALSYEDLKEHARCASYLQKHKKNRFVGQWHKRYCLLVDCFLFYYKSETGSKDKGVINLHAQKIHIPSKDKSFTFHLSALDKSGDAYAFQADTTDDFEKWKFHLDKFIDRSETTNECNVSGNSQETPTTAPDDGETYEVCESNQNNQDSDSQFSVDNIYMGLYDCVADNSDELSFKSGDVLYILERLNAEWWLGCFNGICGYVPSTYLTTPFI